MKKNPHAWKSNLENDCIVLLNYLYRHPYNQSYRKISEDTGIPRKMLEDIIKGYRRRFFDDWALEYYASKYGFVIKYIGKPGCILWVDKIDFHD